MASGTFTFISTGLTTALERAKAAAKGKNILAHSPDIAQQLLRAGLLDEIQLHLAPILLGAGRESPIVTQRTGLQAARCLVSRTRRGRPSGRPPRSHR
jgi:dihydrofolate reductase